MTTISLVGSTGSIGTQALEVVRAEPDRFQVVALGANTSVQRLAAQAHAFHPDQVVIGQAELAGELSRLVPPGIEVLSGPEGLAQIATQADVVLNAIVGFAGLPVTMAALKAGRRLALANKESLIAAGPIVARYRQTAGAEILPVDSEHCAIHQCLRSGRGEVARLVLTASGGPFRGRSQSELGQVSVTEALAHPTWTMGPKITVDSSTLMNKGLEVIEAHELFGIDYGAIEVVVHPQSVVHSMVTFTDGATMAQLSRPDMRLPIGYALGYPDRLSTPYGELDFSQALSLDFEAPDHAGFACLNLAFEAGRTGGTAPAWMSGANEVAVEAFLDGRLDWLGIAEVVDESLQGHDGVAPRELDDILAADAQGRSAAAAAIARRPARQARAASGRY